MDEIKETKEVEEEKKLTPRMKQVIIFVIALMDEFREMGLIEGGHFQIKKDKREEVLNLDPKPTEEEIKEATRIVLAMDFRLAELAKEKEKGKETKDVH